jgi:hypothetical protein
MQATALVGLASLLDLPRLGLGESAPPQSHQLNDLREGEHPTAQLPIDGSLER